MSESPDSPQTDSSQPDSDRATDVTGTTGQPAEEQPTPTKLADRVRDRAAQLGQRLSATPSLARAQLVQAPAAVRGQVERALGRVRSTFDMPSRREMTDLAARVNDLDEKLNAYEAAQGARKKRKRDDATA